MLPKFQHFFQWNGNGSKEGSHGLLVERLGFNSLLLEPCLHLRHAVRIFKPGQIFQSVRQFFLGERVNLDSFLHKQHIQTYPTVIDLLV